MADDDKVNIADHIIPPPRMDQAMFVASLMVQATAASYTHEGVDESTSYMAALAIFLHCLLDGSIRKPDSRKKMAGILRALAIELEGP